jgi:4-hydroxybenzoate polyprenyltransferase
MDISSSLSNTISSLSPKIKKLWRSGNALLQSIFKSVKSQAKITAETLALTLAYIIKQLDRLIDYLAQHPLLDKTEALYRDLKNQVINWHFSVQQSPAYKKAGVYAQLIRLDKPIGILLLLWPTLIALWIAASGWPDPKVLFVFIVGVILMRSAGCAINDYADRDIDNKVERTKQRPLTSGKITEKEALLVFASLGLTAFILVLFMNELTIWMSLGGILLAASYPFMKRYHYLPQVHLGAAFGWAAPMAYAAQANELTAVTWLIFLATVLWATVYDTMYAMVDYDDDIKIGVKSTAILFGNQDRLIIGIIQILLIFNLILIGHRAELSGFYYLGVTAASVFAAYQQYLIKDREREQCFKAFLNNNWFGMVLFIGVFLDYQFASTV